MLQFTFHFAMKMIPFIFVVFLSILFAAVLKHFHSKFIIYKKFSSLTGFHSSSSFIFGSLHVMFKAYMNGARGAEISRALLDISRGEKYQKCGYMAVWLGNFIIGVPMVICTGNDLSRLILSSNQVLEKPYFYRFLHFSLGKDSLLYEKSELWRKHRKFVNKMFNSNSVQKYRKIMKDASEEIIEKIKSRKIFEPFSKIIFQSVLDANAQLVTGAPCPLPNNFCDDFRKAAVISTEHPILFNKFCRMIHSMEAKFVSNVIQVVQNLSRGKLSNIQYADAVRDADERMSWINQLVIMYKDNYAIDKIEDMIINDITILLLASFDTISNTIINTLQFVSEHANVQEKLYQTLLNEPDKNGDAHKNRYLNRTILETLRLCPPIPIIGRQATADIICRLDNEDAEIPKGCFIIFFMDAMHRNEYIWKDANIYNPERFDMNDAVTNKYALIPFSQGPRACVGSKFAMEFISIILRKIFLSFRVSPKIESKDIVYDKRGLFVEAKDPLDFSFHPRQSD